MDRFSRALDWSADHVGDVYFVALAIIGVGAIVFAAVAVVASLL